MADTVKEPELLKIGFGVWMSFCVLLCLWFFKTFTTGRSGFQKNLHVIEDGLKKMQESLELRQRQKSMGYTDDMEDISEFMKKFEQAKYDSEVCSKQYCLSLLSCFFSKHFSFILIKCVHVSMFKCLVLRYPE